MTRLLTFCSALMLSLSVAGSAWAGSGYKASLVPTNNAGPPAVQPQISIKSKLQVKDTGKFQAKLQGVRDVSAVPVTTNGSLDAAGILDGDEYVVVLRGTALAFGGIAFEFDLVMELKGGKGKAKVDAASLFSLIAPGANRSVVIEGGDVYGPIGASNVDECQALHDGSGYSIPPSLNPCVEGLSRIGTTGILLALH